MDDKQSQVEQPQPGTTIQPEGANHALPTVVAPTEPTAVVSSQPVAPPAQEAPASTILAELPAETAAPIQASPMSDDPERITWTASEFVEHDKSFDWYLALGVVAVVVAVGLYALFHDKITSGAILFVALVLGYYARRKPRTLDYALDSHGVTIGAKYLPYDMFRSFAVMDEGVFSSIAFLPLKRFGLLTTVYYDPQDEERILDLINQHLPLEPREHDPVDRFMKRIRF